MMLQRLIACLDLALNWIAILAVGGLTLCVMLGVISRAFNNPFDWTEELSRFLMIWVAALGWVLATRRGLHIRIRFFHDLLPRFWWSAAEIVMQLAVAVFGLLVVVYGVELVQRNVDIEATTVPLTMMWIYVPLVLGGVAATLQAIADIAGAWRGVADAPDQEGGA